MLANVLDLLTVEWKLPEETNHYSWSNQLGTWATVLAMMAGAWWALKTWTAKKPARAKLPWVPGHLRFFRRYHLWLGFLALGLATVHGVTHFITEWGNIRILSGLLVFLFFIMLTLVGWRYYRERTGDSRRRHRWLAGLLLVVLFIHAGGSMIFTFLLFTVYGLGLFIVMRVRKQ
jgi:hypothetical protein